MALIIKFKLFSLNFFTVLTKIFDIKCYKVCTNVLYFFTSILNKTSKKLYLTYQGMLRVLFIYSINQIN